MKWGAVAPKFVQLTKDVVFDNLWRRSDLTLRDRSLVPSCRDVTTLPDVLAGVAATSAATGELVAGIW